MGVAPNPARRAPKELVMEFGIQFFPDVSPAQKSAADYFTESLKLVELCDEYGYSSVRTVEHYFLPYGGYSPNPLLFLTAAAAHTKKARLIVGAALPAFNHPLKIAGEAGMLDAISGGRLELGFARAFLPHEFAQFGVALDESVARFDEGLEQVRRLLEEENVTSLGRFHSFKNVTSLPRPTQKPRPPIWVAALGTPASFEKAGRLGHAIMAIPLAATRMRELLGIYRDAWKAAGHPGNGRVMLAFHMLCHETPGEAIAIAREPLGRYLKSIVGAASHWITGTSSQDYPGYDKVIAQLDRETVESQIASGAAWIGTPAEIVAQIEDYRRNNGAFEIASLQVNFNTLSYPEAAASMRLFGAKVIPHFAKDAVRTAA
jgi:alkanesulfonate monooxygenase SsuD/methylene tetrahydromethanopterin reductase-like flavin-dependent oxidoreductase (luciferase family)